MVLGDVGRIADAVDARRRGVDEAPHPRVASRHNQRFEALVVDRPAQRRIQLEAGIVRDAGQVDDVTGAAHRLRDHGTVADVAFDALEGTIAGGQHVVPEEEEVEDTYAMSAREKLWNEHRADIARPSGDDDRPLSAHAPSPFWPRMRIAHQRPAIVRSALAMFRHDTALERPC